jgi:dTDP-4-dehydrorhamnose reductase
MNILLTGASGQLGTELIPLLSAKGRVTVTDRSPPSSLLQNWVKLDVTDGGGIEHMLNRLQPELIVNAAAYTAVDQAEAEPATSFDVNAEFPGRLARWAKLNDALLMHYSTDYVFDGKASCPYPETHSPDPQNVYGESKLAGERIIESSGCRHTTLRTSWVYSSHGKNFVLSMLNLARKGLSLKVVDDQVGCPTWAGSLARASITVIEHWQTPGTGNGQGVFHYCDDRQVSWFAFAVAIFEWAVSIGFLDSVPELTPIPSSEFPQPARRPGWSVLDTGKIERVFKIQPASFEHSLQTVISEISTRVSL